MKVHLFGSLSATGKGHGTERAALALAPHLLGETALYQSEYRMRHKDGHWVWVHDVGRVLERNSLGQPVRAVGIHRDISQRKASELRDHLLISALEAVEHGVVITGIDAKIEWVNQAFARVLPRESDITSGAVSYEPAAPVHASAIPPSSASSHGRVLREKTASMRWR